MPQRGEKKDLVEHALANAREALARKLAETSSQRKLLDALAETFGLPRAPRRIEVYDNSHIQGTNAVGAMIVAGPEGFRKNQYRKFNIRSADLTPGDDFGMMREVLSRRFKRLLNEAPRAVACCAVCACGARGQMAPAQDARAGERRRGRGDADGRRFALARPRPHRRRARPAHRRAGDARRRSASPTCRWSPSPRGRTAMPAARPSSCRGASRSSSSRAIRCSISSSGCATRRIASRSARTAPAQAGHPRGRPAGNPRHRADAQARAAASLRHAQGDRARRARRSGASSGHQRRDRAQDLRFLPRARG